MNYRWSKNDRKMMQEIIDYFKTMLKVESKERFLELGDRRNCPFCNDEQNCDICRITKCLNTKCFGFFKKWYKFRVTRIWVDYDNTSLSELKSLLRDAITELEPWGEK